MTCCTATCGRWTLAAFSVVFLILGILASAGWQALYDKVVRYEFSLVNDHTMGYKMWKETPVPIYMEFFMFNWTNFEQYEQNKSIKPHFDQVGPYTFTEMHYRTNIAINHNNTITYQTKRVWHFVPEKTNGSLDDLITTLNPLVPAVSRIVQPKHILVKRGVNVFFEYTISSLTVTKTVAELLFGGYRDQLIEIAKRLNFKDVVIPFDRFGWFYTRNESSEYDGVFNMENGGNGHYRTLGILNMWNYEYMTSYYRGDCAKIQGTSGEYWYPTGEDPSVDVFSPDLCSHMTLHKNGTETLYGIKGNLYVGTEKVFDNGTKYPEMECYTTLGVGILTGLRNVSSCKFSAPAYVSYPHFWLADPAYLDAVDGLSPNPDEHRTTLSLEPTLGVPLRASVALQINMLMDTVEGIDILTDVNKIFIPMMWFRQTASLSESLSNEIKLVLVLPSVGTYLGYAFIVLGTLLLGGFVYMLYKNKWSMKTHHKQG